MKQSNMTIPSREIVDDVLPKLTSLQSLIDHTLSASIQRQNNADERKREESLKAELDTGLFIIRMNIDHLIKRYELTLSQLSDSRQVRGPDIEIDKSEAAAIEHLKHLHQQIRSLYSEA